MKQLRLWNGRGYICRKYSDPRWAAMKYNDGGHANICAYSRADAARLISEYLGYDARGTLTELRDYFSDCWGDNMNGVTPERGIWIEFERGKPTKVWPIA